MGKRELLLIMAFVVAGAIVYQATAPEPPPGQEGVSFSRILNNFKRAVHGNRGSAEITRTNIHAIASGTTDLHLLGLYNGEVTIEGEDRDDIVSTFRVASTGFDDAEAKRLAENTRLDVDASAPAIGFTPWYPQEGRQRSFITLKVPSRLRVRVDQSSSRTTVANVAGVELVSARGETSIKQIAGRAEVTHRGGQLVVDDVDALKLATRSGTDARVTRVRGDGSFDLQGGELNASSIAGSIEIESRSADITLEQLEQSRGPLRISSAGGTISIKNVKCETRIDARNTDIEAAIADDASSIAIYNEGDERIEVTPPSGGYRLDAVAVEGRITLADSSLTVSENGNEQRVNGTVKDGGPTITLRARHGNIVLRGR